MREEIPMLTRDALEGVTRAPVAVLYKHSAYCSRSRRAVREVREFAAAHPDVPTYLIDVIGDRTLSDDVARRFGVRHESPQVIVVRDGVPHWHTSHGGVKAEELGLYIDV